MRCENIFCIYQSNGRCTLDEVSMDILGMCTECIYANIDKDILEQARVKLLKEYEKLDSK